LDSQNSENSVVSERLNLLESIDNLSYRTISFGFPLLTLGIIAGAVWANEAGVHTGVGIPKKHGL